MNELEKPSPKKKRTKFEPSEDVDKEIYNKMVEVRKKLIIETRNTGLKLYSTGKKFAPLSVLPLHRLMNFSKKLKV
jgi:hypothetical protein